MNRPEFLGDSGVSCTSQFPTEQPNRGGVNGVGVGQCEIAGQRPIAKQRPKPADTHGQDREALPWPFFGSSSARLYMSEVRGMVSTPLCRQALLPMTNYQ